MQFLRLSLCCKWVEQSTQTKENTQIFGRKHLVHPIYATVGNLARNRTSQTCSSRMEYMVAQSHQCHISTYLARSRPAGASEGRMLQIWSDCYARMGHISKYQFHGFYLTKRICHGFQSTTAERILLQLFCYHHIKTGNIFQGRQLISWLDSRTDFLMKAKGTMMMSWLTFDGIQQDFVREILQGGKY